jgi:hypothetical protein
MNEPINQQGGSHNFVTFLGAAVCVLICYGFRISELLERPWGGNRSDPAYRTEAASADLSYVVCVLNMLLLSSRQKFHYRIVSFAFVYLLPARTASVV